MPTSANSLPTHLFKTGDAWETWLESHHDKSLGLWMKISKKGSSVTSVSYDEALDVALCFGWIDGQKKSYDDQYFLQKFTPRRKGSVWSKRNVEKVTSLIESGLMRPSGQAKIDAAQADGRWQQAYAGSSTIGVPEDFQTALDHNTAARTFFESLNKRQRYSFLWRIETAKRAETRQRRIQQFVELLSDQKTL